MDRKDFITQIGAGTASLLLFTCMGGCSKDSQSDSSGAATTPSNVDFTLDLTSTANNSLANNGGYVYSNGVIVARTVTGDYIAVSQACTHQGTSVEYQTSDQFYCPNHGSVFSKTGAVLVGPASRPLKRYNTTLTGSRLRVFS